MEWILILQLLSPGGDYMGKIGIPYPNEKSCTAALKQLKKPVDTEYPLAPKAKGWLCVTRGHWNGTAPMPNVPLD